MAKGRHPTKSTASVQRSTMLQSQHHPLTLLPISDAPRTRMPASSSGLGLPRSHPLLVTPNNGAYVQTSVLPPPSSSNVTDATEPPVEASEDPPQLGYDFNTPAEYVTTTQTEDLELRASRSRRKREKQWKVWMSETIPALLGPYIEHLRKSDSYRVKLADPLPRACKCGGQLAQTLNIACVFFESECDLSFHDIVSDLCPRN